MTFICGYFVLVVENICIQDQNENLIQRWLQSYVKLTKIDDSMQEKKHIVYRNIIPESCVCIAITIKC